MPRHQTHRPPRMPPRRRDLSEQTLELGDVRHRGGGFHRPAVLDRETQRLREGRVRVRPPPALDQHRRQPHQLFGEREAVVHPARRLDRLARQLLRDCELAPVARDCGTVAGRPDHAGSVRCSPVRVDRPLGPGLGLVDSSSPERRSHLDLGRHALCQRIPGRHRDLDRLARVSFGRVVVSQHHLRSGPIAQQARARGRTASLREGPSHHLVHAAGIARAQRGGGKRDPQRIAAFLVALERECALEMG